MKLELMIMSGVEDGRVIDLDAEAGDGTMIDDEWVLTIGRRDESDVCLRNDSFISREHARLTWRANCWWLADSGSKNGTFVDQHDEDLRVEPLNSHVPVQQGQLFRIGRTWLRIQPNE